MHRVVGRSQRRAKGRKGKGETRRGECEVGGGVVEGWGCWWGRGYTGVDVGGRGGR